MQKQKNNSLENKKSRYLESQILMVLITLSGGLQDAYTFFMRGGVFANAQTGNVVLMTGSFFNGEFAKGLKYLVPIVVFALGILLADQIRIRTQNIFKITHGQIIVLLEATILFITGFIPEGNNYNLIANGAVSFCCAMQIETFKKVKGYPYASTMCIGNLKNAMDALSKFLLSASSKKRREFLQYVFIVFVFALGAGLGTILCNILGLQAIFASSLLLFISFILLKF